MKKYYLLVLAVFLYGTTLGQDKVYKKGGEIIDAKVIELGTDEVKYKLFNDQNGPTYSLDKDRIIKIVYENGRIESYQSNLADPELYADQSKNAIKINFLSPLLGYTQFNFEHNLRPGRGYEVSLGIIGLGKRQELASVYDQTSQASTTIYREARGFFAGGGYKFSKMPDFINKGSKYSHILQGAYVKPEILMGLYGENNIKNPYGNSTQAEKESIFFGGLLINSGKQWVFGNAFLVDLYGGLGYAFDNSRKNNNNSGEQYYSQNFAGNHFALITGADTGVGFTAGFKVGLLLNPTKN